MCLDYLLIFGEGHLQRVLTFVCARDGHALGVGRERAATTAVEGVWDHRHHTNLVRIASSLRADMIFGKDSWLVFRDGHPIDWIVYLDHAGAHQRAWPPRSQSTMFSVARWESCAERCW